MSDRSRIPVTIPEFNSYLNTTDDYLAAGGPPTTNGARLGLSTQDLSDWAAQRTDWRDTLYPKYTNANTSTSVVKEDVHDFMHDFRAFAQPLLNIMAASPNATNADAQLFNFTIGHAAPTHTTTPIAATVNFEAKQLGGGDLRFSCTFTNDATRASKPEGADSVQLSYVIQNSMGQTPPNAEDPGMIREIFTKAGFTKHCGAGNIQKVMIVFARWYNTKHPDLAGPWSAVTSVVIA